jgi:hypothetical protein
MMLGAFYIDRVKVLVHGRVRCVSYEEKGIWVYLVTSAGAYAVYLAIILGRVDYFWIANVIYLGFVLWAVAGSVLKLVAYRRGL